MSAPATITPATFGPFDEYHTPIGDERRAMIEYVRAAAPSALLAELNYFEHDVGDREYAYDTLAALLDVADRNEGKEGDKALLKLARRMLISIGFYRVMPKTEQDMTIRLGGGTVYNFRLDGVEWVSDQLAEEWQFPDEAEARP